MVILLLFLSTFLDCETIITDIEENGYVVSAHYDIESDDIVSVIFYDLEHQGELFNFAIITFNGGRRYPYDVDHDTAFNFSQTVWHNEPDIGFQLYLRENIIECW
jgi:hypothetical protein